MEKNLKIMNEAGEEQKNLPGEIVAVIMAAIEAQNGVSCCEIPSQNREEVVNSKAWAMAGIKEAVARRQLGHEMFM